MNPVDIIAGKAYYIDDNGYVVYASSEEENSSEEEDGPEITANKAYALFERGNLQYVLIDEEVAILTLKRDYELVLEERDFFDLKKINAEKLAALNLRLEMTYINSIYGK